MAYEFKKLSDVNILEEKKTGLNVLVEDAGEIVKISNDDLNPHNVYTVVDTTYYYGKESGSINSYFQDPISTVVSKFQLATNKAILERGILSGSSISMHSSIGHEIIGQDDGTFDAIVYYNDLHPLYLSSSNNTITLLEGWEEPAPSIPVPATAEVGQVIAVKAVDENGKPTEWEAISTEKYQIAFVDNAGTYSCPSHTYEEIHNMFTKTMNKVSAILITTPNYDGTPHIAVLQNFETRRIIRTEGSSYRFSFRDSFEDTTICLEIEPNGTVTKLE